MTDNDDLMRAYARISRHERRERIARQVAVVRAAQKAGLMIRSTTIEGVPLELQIGEPAASPAAKPEPVTELDQWIAKHARAS
jgi:hypothetical protein